MTRELAALVVRLSDALDKCRIARDNYRVQLAEKEFQLDRLRVKTRALEVEVTELRRLRDLHR